MKLHELKPVEGARKSRKRVGRGMSSGHGKTGRGHKGQNARTGGGVGLVFEGGQLPLFRAIPKRGFTNINRKSYSIVNISDLNKFEAGTVVTPEVLFESGLVRKNAAVKVLGSGELNVKLTVQAHKFSQAAKEAIEAQGGTVEVI